MEAQDKEDAVDLKNSCRYQNCECVVVAELAGSDIVKLAFATRPLTDRIMLLIAHSVAMVIGGSALMCLRVYVRRCGRRAAFAHNGISLQSHGFCFE